MIGRRKGKKSQSQGQPTPPRLPQGRLVALNPTEPRTHQFVLGLRENFSIGSDETSNDFVLPTSSVSRRHATITYADGRYRIIDLNSTNGTFLNGRRITESTKLQNGDEVRFGTARFIVSLATSGALANGPSTTPGTTGTVKRSRGSSVRSLAEVILVAFVLGFGIAQYLAYRLYHAQNQLLLAKAVPVPVSQTRATRPSVAAPATTKVDHAPEPQKLAQVRQSKPSEPFKAAATTKTSNLPRQTLSSVIRPNELRAAITLTSLFSGSGMLSGDAAPDFTLSNLSGGSVSLSAFRGKVVLLNFWATWCPSCRGEMPSLAKLFEEFKNRSNFALLTVSIDQNGAAAVRPFIQSTGYKFPVLLDPSNHVSKEYEVTGIPSTFLIGRSGEILWNCAGGIDWSNNQITSVLRTALGSRSKIATNSDDQKTSG